MNPKITFLQNILRLKRQWAASFTRTQKPVQISVHSKSSDIASANEKNVTQTTVESSKYSPF